MCYNISPVWPLGGNDSMFIAAIPQRGNVANAWLELKVEEGIAL